MSKDHVSLIREARERLKMVRTYASQAISFIDCMEENPGIEQRIEINDNLAFLRMEAEKLAEIEKKLRAGKFS